MKFLRQLFGKRNSIWLEVKINGGHTSYHRVMVDQFTTRITIDLPISLDFDHPRRKVNVD